MVKYVYFCVCFSIIFGNAQATMISAISAAQQMTENREYMNGWKPEKLHVNFTPDSGSVFDPNCFTVSGYVRVHNLAPTSVSHWGVTSFKPNYTGEHFYRLTVKNSCGMPVGGNVTVQFKSGRGNYYGKKHVHYHSLNSQQCAVDVNTTPAIPDIYPRESISPVQITSNGSGTGALSFIPGKRNGEKGVLLNDNNQEMTYSVSDAKWSNSLGGWSGSIADYYLNIDKITSSTPGGIYSGTLAVRISCD
jgi:hypothetical protein